MTAAFRSSDDTFGSYSRQEKNVTSSIGVALNLSGMETMADRIRSARIRAGYQTSAEAARRLGIKPATYRHYENDMRKPRPDRIPDIAKLFKVSAQWILTGRTVSEADETEIVDLYRRSNNQNRQAVLTLLRQLNGIS